MAFVIAAGRKGGKPRMERERVDCVVVGAGVVGLAAARALALAGREVVILERGDAIGTGTSSRNSEVIHAGIYYPKDSLKARTCVAGKVRLYDYCRENGIDHARCGKLIVATSAAQTEKLGTIARAARANGVDDLKPLTAAEAQALEPNLACVAALHSPSTGIIDSHGLMLSFQGESEAHGAAVAFNTEVAGATVRDDGIELRTRGAEAMALVCRTVVNAAGLDAPAVAGRIEGLAPQHVPKAYYAKGNYYSLTGRAPFDRLVYPVPEDAGLGVHITVDLGGQARFGPDVEWIDKIDYGVDPARAERFYSEIRKYWPDLPDGALQPGYAGIRPKIKPRTEQPQDFDLQGPARHGVPGLINMFGIESPGLTASMALADLVAAMAKDG